MPTLVVIVGPTASGKSTTARALGDRFRAAGRPVAVLDLDELVETIGGFVGLTDERFRQAQKVFGQLVGPWLDRGELLPTMPPSEWTFDTTATDTQTIVDVLATSLLS